MSGFLVEDTVCLNEDEEGDLCVDNFEFVALTEASGLEGMDGILGMSPFSDKADLSLINALTYKKIID